jgi:hypothetical protein
MICLKCGHAIVIGPAGCACTQAARFKRSMTEATKVGKELAERFKKAQKSSRRWHWNNGRTNRKGLPMPACGETRDRNLSPHPTMVNCLRCLRIMQKERPDAYSEALGRTVPQGGVGELELGDRVLRKEGRGAGRAVGGDHLPGLQKNPRRADSEEAGDRKVKKERRTEAPDYLVRHCNRHCGGLKKAKPGYAVSHNTHCPVIIFDRHVTHVYEAVSRLENEGYCEGEVYTAVLRAMRAVVDHYPFKSRRSRWRGSWVDTNNDGKKTF